MTLQDDIDGYTKDQQATMANSHSIIECFDVENKRCRGRIVLSYRREQKSFASGGVTIAHVANID